MSTLRRYTAEFKQDALRYVENHPDLSTKKVAEYLGIPKDTLYDWERKARSNEDDESIGTNTSKAELEKENARLRRELRDSNDAIEVLKKAISILGD